MPAKPHSYRCAHCDTNWPVGDDMRICPRCRRGTDESWMIEDYSLAIARKIANGWRQWRDDIPARYPEIGCAPFCTCRHCIDVRFQFPGLLVLP